MIALTLSAVGAGVAASVGALTITAALMPLTLLFGGGAVLALGIFAALGFGLLVKTLTVAVSHTSVLDQTQLSMSREWDHSSLHVALCQQELCA